MAWNLPTMAEVNAVRRPNTKGKTRKQLKARKDREDAKQLKAFRDAVWLREENRAFGWDDEDCPGYARTGRCQHCQQAVHRFSHQPMTGEVHHRIGRRTKATRYDPANGVLLCNHLVNNCHEKAQRGEITV